MPDFTDTRQHIAELRRTAAECLASPDIVVRSRSTGYLRMVEILKVRMMVAGENVTVTTRSGTTYGRSK